MLHDTCLGNNPSHDSNRIVQLPIFPTSPAIGQRTKSLLAAKSWAFQLKNLEPEQQAKLAGSNYDLVVIDSEKFIEEEGIPLTALKWSG
jgi:hypothetical protein